LAERGAEALREVDMTIVDLKRRRM
jgi:hypothetical protein